MAVLHKKTGHFLQVCFKRYRNRPDLFAQEVLKLELSEQQNSALIALANGKRKVAVKSGHKRMFCASM